MTAGAMDRQYTPTLEQRPPLGTPAEGSWVAEDAAPRRAAPVRHNPSFGPAYWILGLAAALPAFLSALALLACAGRVPRVPQLPVGPVLGGLLVALALGAFAAHVAEYPAWTHPGVTLIPILGFVLPVAALHGQIVTLINGDPDPLAAAPLGIVALLLAAATLVAAIVAATIGRHAPSFSGTALLPVPLLVSWAFVLAPPFREEIVIRGAAAALALAAGATFVAWIAPRRRRPFVPLAAIGAQMLLFWALRLRWPGFGGAVRPIIAFDLALFVGAIVLIGAMPAVAAWMRRAGWPAITGSKV